MNKGLKQNSAGEVDGQSPDILELESKGFDVHN